MFASAAHERWPEATLWVSPGLPDKFDKFEGFPKIEEPLPDTWPAEVQARLLEGAPTLGEVIFYHGPSRSLIVTDFIMYATQKNGFVTDMVMKLEGVFMKFNVPRLIKFLTKDKTKFTASLAPFVNQPIDRVIMAHGDVLEENAEAEFKRAVAYLPFQAM